MEKQSLQTDPTRDNINLMPSRRSSDYVSEITECNSSLLIKQNVIPNLENLKSGLSVEKRENQPGDLRCHITGRCGALVTGEVGVSVGGGAETTQDSSSRGTILSQSQ